MKLLSATIILRVADQASPAPGMRVAEVHLTYDGAQLPVVRSIWLDRYEEPQANDWHWGGLEEFEELCDALIRRASNEHENGVAESTPKQPPPPSV